jgi:hypothetical protein
MGYRALRGRDAGGAANDTRYAAQAHSLPEIGLGPDASKDVERAPYSEQQARVAFALVEQRRSQDAAENARAIARRQTSGPARIWVEDRVVGTKKSIKGYVSDLNEKTLRHWWTVLQTRREAKVLTKKGVENLGRDELIALAGNANANNNISGGAAGITVAMCRVGRNAMLTIGPATTLGTYRIFGYENALTFAVAGAAVVVVIEVIGRIALGRSEKQNKRLLTQIRENPFIAGSTSAQEEILLIEHPDAQAYVDSVHAEKAEVQSLHTAEITKLNDELASALARAEALERSQKRKGPRRSKVPSLVGGATGMPLPEKAERRRS